MTTNICSDANLTWIWHSNSSKYCRRHHRCLIELSVANAKNQWNSVECRSLFMKRCTEAHASNPNQIHTRCWIDVYPCPIYEDASSSICNLPVFFFIFLSISISNGQKRNGRHARMEQYFRFLTFLPDERDVSFHCCLAKCDFYSARHFQHSAKEIFAIIIIIINLRSLLTENSNAIGILWRRNITHTHITRARAHIPTESIKNYYHYLPASNY